MSDDTIDFRPYGKQPRGSGVTAVCIRDDALIVRFQNGDVYVYDAGRPGAVHLARMIMHARANRGLSGYISQHVGANYARKLTLL